MQQHIKLLNNSCSSWHAPLIKLTTGLYCRYPTQFLIVQAAQSIFIRQSLVVLFMKNVAKSSAIRIVNILWHFWNLYLKVLDPIDLYCGQKILPNFLFCVLQKTKKRNLFETALMRGNNGRIFIFR